MSFQRFIPRSKQYTGSSAGIPGLPYSPSLSSEGVYTPDPKEAPVQHAGYMAAVRLLPCAMCGVQGYTQFCHADILGRGGKGMGIKSDCRLGWPGCGPQPEGEPGCHWYIGSSGVLTKAERRHAEKQFGDKTRAEIERLGKWPASLPRWKEPL